MAQDVVKNLFKVVLGLILGLVGVALIYLFRFDVLTLVKGSVGLFIGLIGLLFLMLGISELKG